MEQTVSWQREKDSNPHIRSQSPLCYLYTIPLNAREIITSFARFVNSFFAKSKNLFIGAILPKKRALKFSICSLILGLFNNIIVQLIKNFLIIIFYILH